MDASLILSEFARARGLPSEAIEAARRDREVAAPVFLASIADYLDGKQATAIDEKAFFLAFHLLGEWREKSAYCLFGRVLRRPSEEVDRLLGDAITETSHRVMVAVFDGDTQPLHQIICDPQANEFIRSRMCEALAMLAVGGLVSRQETARFLRDCRDRFRDQPGNAVWDGWQQSIALLGLRELRPYVCKAFEAKLIDPMTTELRHFDQDLAYALAHPCSPHPRWDSEYSPFGDTCVEFSNWAFAKSGVEEDSSAPFDDERVLEMLSVAGEPAINHFRDVGRNDPCPCGSGKKFKKCCLN